MGAEPVLRPGQVLVVAGTGVPGYSGNGFDARRARLSDEIGLAAAPDGTLYFADAYSDTVSRVHDGQPTVIAGKPFTYGDENGDGGPATEAAVPGPADVAVDRNGVVYISAEDGIRRVDGDGVIETVLRPAARADSFEENPAGALALDAHGNLYFTEKEFGRVLVRPGALRIEGAGWPWFGTNAAAALAVVVVAFAFRRRIVDLVAPARVPDLA